LRNKIKGGSSSNFSAGINCAAPTNRGHEAGLNSVSNAAKGQENTKGRAKQIGPVDFSPKVNIQAPVWRSWVG